MKKTNAVAALITDALLALHLWVMTYSLFTGWYDLVLCKALGGLLCVAFAAHALLTIGIFFFCHEGAALSCKKENIGTILQRVEGLLMLVFIHTHSRAYDFMATGEPLTRSKAIRTGLGEVLFIFAVCAHAAFSSARALVSLGIVRSERALKGITRVCDLIFGLSGVTAIVAVIRFLAVS